MHPNSPIQKSVTFHPSNWKLLGSVERLLLNVMVTPRMHGIHHSVVRQETNSNYSNMFNMWDRLHRTLRLNVPQDEVRIGLPAFLARNILSWWELIRLSFQQQENYWQWPDGTEPERAESPAPHRLARGA